MTVFYKKGQKNQKKWRYEKNDKFTSSKCLYTRQKSE